MSNNEIDCEINLYKFSENGAKQLSSDFSFLRTWVEGTQHLTEDSKR